MRILAYLLRPIRKYVVNFVYRAHIAKVSDDLHALTQKGLLSIGDHTYGQPRIDVYRGSEAHVTIGKYCSISRDVVFVTGGIHPVEWISTYPFRAKFGLPGAYVDGMPRTKGSITVGSDVWIGTGVTILSGVNLGDGVVVAAGAIVTKSVPPFAIVGGVPAQVIDYRFRPDQIDLLMRARWWDWPHDEVIEIAEILSSSSFDRFVSYWEQRQKGNSH